MPKKTWQLIWAILVVICHGNSMANPEKIQVMLCCENCSQKDKLLVNDALMLQLLLKPKVSVLACLNRLNEKYFLFKQEIHQIGAERIMVLSNLFAPDTRSMWGRVEFFKHLLKSTMNKRASLFSKEIIKAIEKDSKSPDLFQNLKHNERKEPITIQNRIKPDIPTSNPKPKPIFLGLGVGLTSKTHVAPGQSDLKKVATKSFLISGLNFEGAIDDASWLIKNSFQIAYVDLRIARPNLIKNSVDGHFALSFMSNATLLKQIYEHDSLGIFLGGQVLFRTLDSKLDLIVKNAVEPRYMYLEEGLVFLLKKFSHTLNTKTSLEISFSPFLQSFLNSSYKPLSNFAWSANINFSTNLYRSFFVFLNLGHHGESLISNNVRVVCYGQLGFLGLAAEI